MAQICVSGDCISVWTKKVLYFSVVLFCVPCVGSKCMGGLL